MAAGRRSGAVDPVPEWRQPLLLDEDREIAEHHENQRRGDRILESLVENGAPEELFLGCFAGVSLN